MGNRIRLRHMIPALGKVGGRGLRVVYGRALAFSGAFRVAAYTQLQLIKQPQFLDWSQR